MTAIKGTAAAVTGAASGIGRALANRLAAEGMKVVLADLDGGALATAERERKLFVADLRAVAEVIRGLD